MEDDLKIWKGDYLSNHWSDLPQIWNLSLYDQIKEYKGVKWRCAQMEGNLQWPQNIKSGIFQQPLAGSYANLKLKIMGVNQRVQKCQMKMTSNGRRPKTEDNPKYDKLNVKTTNIVLLT